MTFTSILKEYSMVIGLDSLDYGIGDVMLILNITLCN